MVKIRGLILLVVLVIVALAVVSSSAQKQQKKRPRPAAAAVGGGNKNKKSNKKPQKKNNVFNTSVAGLGMLRGRTFRTDWTGKSFMQFLDLPYGKSPKRFQPAEPAAPWKNVLPAHRHHDGCPSIQDLVRFAKLEDNGVDVEDCLRLTVNTKALKGKLAPVMVYVHGDFFYEGDSVEAAPGFLLEQDVVLVSVRYRLGPFGFLSTMTEDMPGNVAVTDIILALQWVQKHIAGFGGDPTRVTLFGQVGGAALVNVLTLSPAVPKGLFHRVIYHSGTALSPAFITDAPMEFTKDIARIAGCKQVNKPESLAKCLSRLNATELLTAFTVHGDEDDSMCGGIYSGVQLVIGGPSGILPEHPGRLLAAEKFQAYPTLGGSVKNGGTFMLREIFVDSFNGTIMDKEMKGEQYIDHVINQINGDDPTGAWRKFATEEIFSAADIEDGTFKRMTPGLIDLCSTISQKNPVLLVLQANAKKLPNSTYLYSFDYEGEMNRYASTVDESLDLPFDMGVSLTDDNLYLFPWPRFSSLNSARDIKIAKRMVALWTSFATNGVPQAMGMLDWPSMSDETGPYMRIGRIVSLGENYLEEYSRTVQESKQGYSLVNDDFYMVEEALRNSKEKEDEEEGIENSEEEMADTASEARGQNLVFIAKQSARFQKRNIMA